ncbi:MAG: hypothetical protein R3199_03000 [Gemmatimonadota bacterium]|nr:hypothetical protein [Gemmatimonadota bacterium]
MSPRSSLVTFHRILISTGILFCGGFAVWTAALANREGSGWMWILAAVFALLALALSVYLYNLRRILDLREDE